jgi:hypothetical protein
MSDTYSVLPGTLNLAVRRGDELGTTIAFGLDMTGYTVTASILSVVTGDSAGTMTATITSPSAGSVAIAMSESQTSALEAATYRWNLQWIEPGDVTRTALAGFLDVTR